MITSLYLIATGNIKPYERNDSSFNSSYKKDQEHKYIDIDEFGILEDTQSDKKNHGGTDKALLIGSSVHLKNVSNDYKLAFGCNIFINKFTEEDICVGDVYSIGEVLIQVTQPRQACWKIAAIFDKEISRYIKEEDAVGWYVKILIPGIIDIKDKMILEQRMSDVTIKELSMYLKEPPKDEQLVQKILDIEFLGQSYKDDFEKLTSSQNEFQKLLNNIQE
jgi:MOSC domain-containing protein YiiM